MRFAIWTAVSTAAQTGEDKESLTEQETKCRTIAEGRGWTESTGPYIVPGESRTRWVNLRDAESELPQLRQMLEAAKAGRFDVLVMYDYNRLRDLADSVAKVLASYGVQIFSTNQPVEPIPPEEFNPYATDSESMMRGMSQIISRWQISDLRRKYRFGVPARVRRGLYGLKIPYGYRKPPGRDGDKNVVPIQVEAEVAAIREIKDLFLSGVSFHAIVRQLNAKGFPTAKGAPWARTTIRKILENPWYAGKVYFGRVRVVRDARDNTVKIVKNQHPLILDGKHEPLYSWEEYIRILDEFEHRGRFSFSAIYPFSGLLVCSECGGRIKHKRTYWHCLKNHVKFSEQQALELIPPLIQEAFYNAGAMPRAIPQSYDPAPILADLERRIKKIQADYEREIYTPDEAEKRIKDLKKQMDQVQDGEAERLRQSVSQSAFYATLDRIQNIRVAEWIRVDDAETVNPILIRLIRSIHVTPFLEMTISLRLPGTL
jgi:DNA invertase Pin-like site-specific DNA recombinase